MDFFQASVNITQFSPKVHAFFISSTFISNARLKLATNQGNAKQHLDAELLVFENYSHFSSTLSSKKIGHVLKNNQKYECVFIHEIYD